MFPLATFGAEWNSIVDIDDEDREVPGVLVLLLTAPQGFAIRACSAKALQHNPAYHIPTSGRPLGPMADDTLFSSRRQPFLALAAWREPSSKRAVQRDTAVRYEI